MAPEHLWAARQRSVLQSDLTAAHKLKPSPVLPRSATQHLPELRPNSLHAVRHVAMRQRSLHSSKLQGPDLQVAPVSSLPGLGSAAAKIGEEDATGAAAPQKHSNTRTRIADVA